MESKKQLLDTIAKIGGERKTYLEDLFMHIPENVVHAISYIEVPQGKNILCAGEASDTLYILLSGNVLGLDYQNMGRVYSFMDFTQMFIIGDFELFQKEPTYFITIQASTDCKLLKLPSYKYLEWIKHDEHALFLRLSNILSTLAFERQFDREYIFMDCKGRLISYLIKLYERDEKNYLEEVKVDKTQEELSLKVGFNKRSVQRSIASLEDEGLITVENGKIRISYQQYLQMKIYKKQSKLR